MEEKAKFDGIFESLLPINGLLSGDKVKPVLMNSKLPLDVLGRVSGSLTSCKATEFCWPHVAPHECLQGFPHASIIGLCKSPCGWSTCCSQAGSGTHGCGSCASWPVGDAVVWPIAPVARQPQKWTCCPGPRDGRVWGSNPDLEFPLSCASREKCGSVYLYLISFLILSTFFPLKVKIISFPQI